MGACRLTRNRSLSRLQRPDNQAPSAATLDQLVDSLANVPGSFVLEGAVWRFIGSQEALLALAGGGDSAVTRLVECIDRDTHARATVDSTAVLLGAMCAYALSHVAYATEFEDDPDANWPGVVSPGATPEQLQAAKRAWQEVVRLRRYRLT